MKATVEARADRLQRRFHLDPMTGLPLWRIEFLRFNIACRDLQRALIRDLLAPIFARLPGWLR